MRSFLVALLALPLTAQAPTVELLRLPSTIRLGDAVRATLKVESPTLPGDPRIPPVEGLRIAVGGPSSNRSVMIVNGRQTISSSFDFVIEVRPTRLGKFELGPIEVPVGGEVLRTGKRVIEVVQEITGRSFGRVEVTVEKARVYVHEPIRFAIDCYVDSQLELAQGIAQNGERYFAVVLEAEWLSELAGGEVLDVPATRTDHTQNTVLDNRLQPADVSVVRSAEGREFTRFQYTRSILPTRSGRRKLIAPILKFTALGDVARDPFNIFPQRSQKEYIVYGEELELEVLPLPQAGRPDPFYGGVGRFTIAARLDKQRVRVGGSVKLILTITGTGNTEHLQVPELEEIPGFHRLGKIANRSKDRVEVTYDLTPKTVEVIALPPIRWNYFDTTPGVESYQEVATAPLALEVLPIEGERTLDALPGDAPKEVEAGVDDIFDLKPAAGSGPAALPPVPARAFALLAAAAPWLLAVLGMLWFRAHRRARADVLGRRAREAPQRLRRALAAGADPVEALVGYLADRLGCEPAAVIGPDLAGRLIAAGIPEDQARQAQAAVDEGVGSRYGGTGGVDRERVSALVAGLQRAGAVLLLACAVLSGAAGASAQDLAKAERAYRDRDFATAAEGFREAAAAGDRRAAYNLGNCLFRQGRYAEALAAYERARLGMPRDEEVLANIALVRERLQLGNPEGEPFLDTVAALRDSFTPLERFWICVLLNALAAGLCCFCGRRLRVAGFVLAVPALFTVVEVAFLGPARPQKGIVVRARADLKAEPDAALEPVLKIRGGVAVEVLGRSDGWTRVRADGRRGWLPSADVTVID